MQTACALAPSPAQVSAATQAAGGLRHPPKRAAGPQVAVARHPRLRPDQDRAAALPKARAPEHAVRPPRLRRLINPCRNYRVSREEDEPSRQFSPEFLRLTRSSCKPGSKQGPPGMVFVPQSEGRSSSATPLVSIGFSSCTAYLLRNRTTGETLLIHFDSGLRSTWDEEDQKIGGDPVQPCTPRHGLLGSDRCGFTQFMAQEGRKEVIPIHTREAFDRREVLAEMEVQGVEVLPPLIIETPERDEKDPFPVWHLAYRPGDDHLAIYRVMGGQGKILHIDKLFASMDEQARARARLKAGPPEKDIATRMFDYYMMLEDAKGLSDDARCTIDLCLGAVSCRNYDPDRADTLLEHVTRREGIPDELLAKLKGRRMLSTDHTVVTALTQVVNQLLRQSAAAGAAAGAYREACASI